MSIDITSVHMEPSNGHAHEHIARVRWQNTSDSAKTGENSRQEIVDWLQADTTNNKAYVADADGRVAVGVVNSNPPYLRTYADGEWTNNLLALPRF
jgi:hypothetical protein